jgi:hypothetical protein
MKIWVIKQSTMTRYFILAASFSLLFSFNFTSVNANEKHATENVVSNNTESGNATKSSADNHGKTLPVSQDAKSPMPVEKHQSHTPTMDETPHIHRFHKERVKKIKKHHSKLWFLGMLLLTLCQVSLLVIAYLHVIH